MSHSPPQRQPVIVVVPAYNAEATICQVCRGISTTVVDEVIVVDDHSTDATATLAEALGVSVIRHPIRRGYGAAQKTAYSQAIDRGAAVVVMVHGDDQYDSRLVSVAVQLIQLGVCDVVLGNRIRTRREALTGGMPLMKYLANRVLTLLQNMLSGQNLGEWHSGFRAYSREVLETIPYVNNSDGYLCDSQILLQTIHFGFRIGDIPMPVRYFQAASSIGFWDATRYSVATLWMFARWFLHRLRLLPCRIFESTSTSP